MDWYVSKPFAGHGPGLLPHNPADPAHLRGCRGKETVVPPREEKQMCWPTGERVPFITWSSSHIFIILPNVYIKFWKGTLRIESSWDKWHCTLERDPQMQQWWASLSLVDEVYSTGWAESLVVTSLGSSHRDGFYFLIEWGLCANKDGLHGEVSILKSSALHWLLWEDENNFRLCIGFIKKFICVFPWHLMEKPKWIFGPTQYFEVALWTQWYTF